MNQKAIVFLICFFFLATKGNAQLKSNDDSVLPAYEDSLKKIAPLILNSSSDSLKSFQNKKFIRLLTAALSLKNSFFYPFDSLATIARLTSPDGRFRIFNWHIPKKRGVCEYFGIIQRYNKKTKSSSLILLNDSTYSINSPEKKVLSSFNWYGAHYYTLLVNRVKRKPYYTFLGWKGYDNQVTIKVIEVMYFSSASPDDSTGKVIFGAPVFKFKDDTARRRKIFQYNARASMSLRWNPRKKMIVFDHLSPDSPMHEGMGEFYGPDFSYDALKFKKRQWTLIEDVDARNPAQKAKKKFKNPEKEKGLTPKI